VDTNESAANAAALAPANNDSAANTAAPR